MMELLRRLFSRRDSPLDTEAQQRAELYNHIHARQENAAIRLARLEIETDLLRRGKAADCG